MKKFYEACERGDIQTLKKLKTPKRSHHVVALPLESNIRCDRGYHSQSRLCTPLYIACKNGHLEVVRNLARRKNIDVNDDVVWDIIDEWRGGGGYCYSSHCYPVLILLSEGRRIDFFRALFRRDYDFTRKITVRSFEFYGGKSMEGKVKSTSNAVAKKPERMNQIKHLISLCYAHYRPDVLELIVDRVKDLGLVPNVKFARQQYDIQVQRLSHETTNTEEYETKILMCLNIIERFWKLKLTKKKLLTKTKVSLETEEKQESITPQQQQQQQDDEEEEEGEGDEDESEEIIQAKIMSICERLDKIEKEKEELNLTLEKLYGKLGKKSKEK